MDRLYRVFGLILSSNLPIPGLAPVESVRLPVDIGVHWGVSPDLPEFRLEPEEPWYVSPYLDALGEPSLRIWRVANGSLYRLAYTNGLAFWLDCAEGTIWSTWPDDASIRDAAHYLLGPVFGIFLRLRGSTCLHASAVAINDFAVIFVGPPGAGKSTTAAALTLRGYSAISDDIVLLGEDTPGSFHVIPACPYLCLWPESVRLMYGSPPPLPPIHAQSEKLWLLLNTERHKFETRTLPLGAIYLIGDRIPGSSAVVEAISSEQALLSLVADTYAANTLDREMRANEFRVLGRLVSRVQIRTLHAGTEVENLGELCDLICNDLGHHAGLALR